ncbi:MAG: SDR family NAD(P)-dependent oxidoreductase [Desulfobacterales bacterium]
MSFKTAETSIAVIGMECYFPKSSGLKAYWRLIFRGEDAISDIPDSHWSVDDYYDPDPKKPDRVTCKRGGFLDPIPFDPARFGIPPATLEATDSSQLIALMAARSALEDAGYGNDHRDSDKTSVILGVTGTQELVIPLSSRLEHPKWRKALESAGVDSEKTEEVIRRLSDAFVSWQENSFPGLLGNVVAGRISNRLDLGGTNCVVDAACASSLAAVYMSMLELFSKRSRMVVTGGVDTLNDVFMHMCFSKTSVLSPTSDARPFSKNSDGTVLGEGVGILVLKRLEDAIADSDRIYAVIRGMGTSSDGKSQSIYAPRADGQVKALVNAYETAGVEPATVELIEAHGTGTRVGDEVEFTALRQFFSPFPEKPRALGSVKSMIGHTKAAAGAAGMIKSILSLYHKILPPTLKVEEPDPNLHIEETSFYLNPQTRPWFSGKGLPRRAGVSSFGFGGSNYHAVLEEYDSSKKTASWDGSVEIIALSADDPEQLKQLCIDLKSAFQSAGSFDDIAVAAAATRSAFRNDRPYRLLWVVERSEWGREDDPKRVHAIEAMIESLENNRDVIEIDINNVHFGTSGKPGKIAFMFPGQGAQYVGMASDLTCIFPQMLDVLEQTNAAFGETRLTDLIYPLPVDDRKAKKAQESELTLTNRAQPAIGGISLGMMKILRHFGLVPDAACGHSFGELVALNAAGWIDDVTLITFAVNRGRLMAEAGKAGDKDPGTMTAVKAPLEDLDRLIRQSHTDVILANRNSPNQGVLSGPTEAIEKAESLCKDNGYKTIRLPVAAAFHSRLLKDAQKPFMKIVTDSAMTPTDIPVYSNTLGAPYPADSDKAKTILGEQILCPVDFVNDVKHLHASGVNVFLEVGPKTVLSGLVKAILGDRAVHMVALDESGGRKSGIWDLATALCRLAALGYPVMIDKWENGGGPSDPPKKPAMEILISGTNYRASKKSGPASNAKEKRPTDSRENTPDAAKPPKIDMPEKIMTTRVQVMDKRHEPQRFKKTSIVGAGSNAEPEKRTENRLPSVTRRWSNGSDFAAEAFKTVQEGLKSMQSLQQQTTRAHETFLQTQMESNKTLQMMIQSTQRLVENAMGLEPNISDADIERLSASASAGLQEEEKFAADSSKAVIGKTIVPTAETPGGETHHDRDRIISTLLQTVSDLTGYPVEMLGLDLDMEADLGIDSIKRVEILSALEEKISGLPPVEPEMMGTLKTLGQIIEVLLSHTPSTEASPHEAEPEHPPVETSASADSTDLADILLATVSDLTGYPVEMLGLDLDMEADLGIDSIKRVEILSALDEKIPGLPPVEPEMIGSLKKLGQIIDYLRSPVSSGGDSVGRAKEPEVIEQESPVLSGPFLKAVDIQRQTVSLRQKPYRRKQRFPIEKGKTIYVMDEPAGLSRAIAGELERRGLNAVLFAPHLPLDCEMLHEAAGLILLPDCRTERFYTPDYRTESMFLKAALTAAKTAAPALRHTGKQKAAFLAGLVRLDGAFGFKGPDVALPISAGLAGLVKTAAIEWPEVRCRCFDLSPDWKEHSEIAAAVADELLNDDRECPLEIGLSARERVELVSTPSPSPEGVLHLGPEDIVLATGGARGVTAAAATALARESGAVFVLLGRSPGPFEEPEWLKAVTREAAMKKAILENECSGHVVKPVDLEKRYAYYAANRELVRTLKSIKACGAHAEYYSVDVNDQSAVLSVCERIRNTYGRISAVIHGAGVLKDRLIVDKTEEQFQQVFDTKVKGMLNLLNATQTDALKYVVLFSSIAARTGNKGQADYAMANEALNKMARHIAFHRPRCRVVSINWGPWDGGMVNKTLKKEFKRAHIPLIPIDAGAQCMVMEMKGEPREAVEVVIGGPPCDTAAVPEQKHDPSGSENKRAHTFRKLAVAFEKTIDIHNFPILESHRLNGVPVVPFALMTEWFGHASLHENPGLYLYGFNDMRVLNGIQLNGNAIRIRLLTGKIRKLHHAFEVDLEIRNSETGDADLVYARAKAVLVDAPIQAPDFMRRDLLDSKSCARSVADVYDMILFHGKDLQGLKEIKSLTGEGMVARVSSAPLPRKWMKNPLRHRWVADPLVLDSAFQMASVWCFENLGNVSLPVYMQDYRQYVPQFPKEPITSVLEVTHAARHKMTGNFTFLGTRNTVIAQMTGFEAVVDESLFRAFKPDGKEGPKANRIKAAG